MDLHKPTDNDRGHRIIQDRPLDMFCLVSTGWICLDETVSQTLELTVLLSFG